MLFSSVVFLFYFLPVILFLYYICFWSRTVQNMLLLAASLLFYAWGEPKNILLLLASIMFNYMAGMLLEYFKDRKKAKKAVLVIVLVVNLGILFIFKYFNFVMQNINSVLGEEHKIQVAKILLPIGISFFTFQAMSYVIDVYRGETKVQKNPFSLGLYIAFFPQLVAGPIVRYTSVAEQIIGRKGTWQKFSAGSCRFVVGLSKKVLLSNQFAAVTDRIFTMQMQGGVPALLAWLGAISYAFQIYYDFSGYSDMAIGLGLMFGFKFEENFNYPYTATSISDFWRRWHISLGSWFKSYVYFPLGGSRLKNTDKVARNLLIVWMLTGIWHGAEWTFFLWGFFNFLLIAWEKFAKFEKWTIKPWIKHVYTLFFLLLFWVIFRADNVMQAGSYLSDLFLFGGHGFFSSHAVMFVKENLIYFLVGILFSMPVARRVNKRLFNRAKGTMLLEMIYPFAISGLFFICICYLLKGTYNPFIYFNF
ncbi:MAG: MBOAT family protein [Lachnospiraceae bacterium]|nr:MBOAT family protein [Lachnospiraceae bacterium]